MSPSGDRRERRRFAYTLDCSFILDSYSKADIMQRSTEISKPGNIPHFLDALGDCENKTAKLKGKSPTIKNTHKKVSVKSNSYNVSKMDPSHVQVSSPKYRESKFDKLLGAIKTS